MMQVCNRKACKRGGNDNEEELSEEEYDEAIHKMKGEFQKKIHMI